MNERLINYAVETLERKEQEGNNRYSDIEQFCYDSLLYLFIEANINKENIDNSDY